MCSTRPTERTGPHPDRLKICVIASTYPRHDDDYAVPWLRTSVLQLAARGHEVTVLAPSYEGLGDHQLDGSQVVRFRYSPRCWERLTHEQGAPNRIRNPWYQLLAVPYVVMGCRAARRLARSKNFDIVHVHWPFPHEPMGSVASSFSNAPLVMTCHGAEFALARRKPWVAKCLKRSLMKATRLIANSSDTAAKIRNLCGREADVLPFGSTVEPKDHLTISNPKSTVGFKKGSDPLPEKVRPLSETTSRLLFTGRLIQRKGVEYLLRAVKIALRTAPVHLVITGDGDQRQRLQSICHDLNIEDAVEFLGFVDNQSLSSEYARCDIWVNPSIIDDRGDTEGLGVGAIEACTHGKPVIASAVGGIPDAVIHNQTGLLVPEKDPIALASAIIELATNPEKSRRLAQGGLRLVNERFNWDQITDRLEELYLECIDGASSSATHPVPVGNIPRKGFSHMHIPAFASWRPRSL